ncbi:MAG: hypothetical protein ABJP08_00480 [Roseibium sp.]
MRYEELSPDVQSYLHNCLEAGAYVDPLRLPEDLRLMMECQISRQRPVKEGLELYYVQDVFEALA